MHDIVRPISAIELANIFHLVKCTVVHHRLCSLAGMNQVSCYYFAYHVTILHQCSKKSIHITPNDKFKTTMVILRHFCLPAVSEFLTHKFFLETKAHAKQILEIKIYVLRHQRLEPMCKGKKEEEPLYLLYFNGDYSSN